MDATFHGQWTGKIKLMASPCMSSLVYNIVIIYKVSYTDNFFYFDEETTSIVSVVVVTVCDTPKAFRNIRKIFHRNSCIRVDGHLKMKPVESTSFEQFL